MGVAKFYTNSRAYNLQNGLSEFALLMNTSVVEATDIAAGGNHSIILASNVKPSSYSFTIIRPDGYALDPQYPTIYPTTQAAG